MRKIICFAFVICLVVACFASCGSIKQNQAQKLIDQGDYQAAYDILKEMDNNKNAQELLQNFQFVLVQRRSGYLLSESAHNNAVYTYNEYGLLCKSESETGVFEYEYDQNKRLVKALYNGSMINEYASDDVGNLVKETIWSGDTPISGREYVYDDQGNLIQEKELRGMLDLPYLQLSYTIDYTYDQDGNMTSMTVTYQNGSTARTDYVYDKDGNLIREERGAVVVEYVYDSKGNILEEKNNSTAVQYTYDQNGHLTQKISKNLTSGYVEYSFIYEYDGNGNVIKETQESQMNGHYKGVTSYTYDKNGNLIQKALSYNSNGNDYAQNFVYDSHGNLIEYTQASPGGQTYVSKMEYQLVYVPYPIHESLLTIIHPEQ
ncbi:MAG: RHS repeat protein [Clostridia bacterium]|nr:RHS repeat protein [Clostridia bacterium]